MVHVRRSKANLLHWFFSTIYMLFMSIKFSDLEDNLKGKILNIDINTFTAMIFISVSI